MSVTADVATASDRRPSIVSQRQARLSADCHATNATHVIIHLRHRKLSTVSCIRYVYRSNHCFHLFMDSVTQKLWLDFYEISGSDKPLSRFFLSFLNTLYNAFYLHALPTVTTGISLHIQRDFLVTLGANIRLHSSTMYIDVAYHYRPSSVVCLSVCRDCKPCKNR